jgi:hypothetical protein
MIWKGLVAFKCGSFQCWAICISNPRSIGLLMKSRLSNCLFCFFQTNKDCRLTNRNCAVPPSFPFDLNSTSYSEDLLSILLNLMFE